MLGGVLASAALLAMVVEPVGDPRPASYELEWNAPASCPAAETIRERIAALVPEPEGGEGVMYVNAVVEATPDGFALALDTEFLGSRSSRRVEAQRCEDLGESTALVVAIALQPGLEGEALVPVPEPAEPPPEPVERTEEPSVAPDDAKTPVSHSREPPRWRPRSRAVPSDLIARIALLAEFGSMPRVGGGNALAFGVLWPRLRVEISGMYLWPRRFDDPEGDSAGLYQLGAVGARACLRVFAKPTEFPLCAGVDAGVLRVDSRGIAPRTIHDAWVAPLIGAGVALRRERVGFWSMAELGITARGSRIFVFGDPVWRTSPVSVRLLAGLEIYFAMR